jgi:glutathione S-transferase
MKVTDIPFKEINIELYSDEGKEQLRQYSNAAKVPVLIASGLTIWDSLAIAEYLAEQHPDKTLWPITDDSRAIARSVTSEMHSGFTAIRSALPMNCRVKTNYNTITPEIQKDIDRICQLWRDCRSYFGEQGRFLFGKFSIADAFFAPIVLRFNSYGIKVGDIEKDYMDTMLSIPALQEWISAGKEETAIVESYEVGAKK